MKSKQRWDKYKVDVIDKDDEFITFISTEESWWDDAIEDDKRQSGRNMAIDTSKKKTIDAKNVVSRNVPDVEDDQTLPSLHTKAGESEEGGSTAMQNILSSPPTM